jgi:hypothetical protein
MREYLIEADGKSGQDKADLEEKAAKAKTDYE